ncbi:MAG: BlaI/MecI/CopY family transcriptional regulator [Planctomycetes bacterium]|nr:BlaI/MecI/CopY family transcriptional regulator [Planctomycetota bacterium]
MRRKTPRPTDSELEILQVLWERGPCTVRQVYEHVGKRRDTGYTTILKLMQIMAEKKLVVRDESNRSHIYSASREQEHTQRQLLSDLIARAFGGSANRLVMQALQAKEISPDEIHQIRGLLDDLEEESR